MKKTIPILLLTFILLITSSLAVSTGYYPTFNNLFYFYSFESDVGFLEQVRNNTELTANQNMTNSTISYDGGSMWTQHNGSATYPFAGGVDWDGERTLIMSVMMNESCGGTMPLMSHFDNNQMDGRHIFYNQDGNLIITWGSVTIGDFQTHDQSFINISGVNLTDGEWHTFIISTSDANANITLYLDNEYKVNSSYIPHNIGDNVFFPMSDLTFVLTNTFADLCDTRNMSVWYDNIMLYNVSFNSSYIEAVFLGNETMSVVNMQNDISIYEGYPVGYSLNMSSEEFVVRNITAIFVYNDTEYELFGYYNVSDIWTFETNFTVPYNYNYTSPYYVDSYWKVNFELFDGSTFNFTQHITQLVDLNYKYIIFLRNERDGEDFNVNNTLGTSFEAVCSNGTVVNYNFYNVNNNISQGSVNFSCSSFVANLNVIQGAGTYMRSLIPKTTIHDNNITFYLLDLVDDTGVLQTFNMLDYTGGQYLNGILRFIRGVNETQQNIIEQQFGANQQVLAYLMKDATYTLQLEDVSGNILNIGSIVASEAGSQIIQQPSISILPQVLPIYGSGAGGNVTWYYVFDNQVANSLAMLYTDLTGLTAYVEFSIYNGTTSPFVLIGNQTFTESNNSITYLSLSGNDTYYTHLLVVRTAAIMTIFPVSEWKVWPVPGSESFITIPAASYLDDIYGTISPQVKKYSSLVFMSMWALIFSPVSIAFGLFSIAAWLGIFVWSGWLSIPVVWMSVIMILCVLGGIAATMRRG